MTDFKMAASTAAFFLPTGYSFHFRGIYWVHIRLGTGKSIHQRKAAIHQQSGIWLRHDKAINKIGSY